MLNWIYRYGSMKHPGILQNILFYNFFYLKYFIFMAYKKTEHYDENVTEGLMKNYREAIKLIGEDPDREGLLKTPERLAKAMQYCTPVSYTHLRAHETDSYLVCRLLLEKKKKNLTTNKINTK